MIISSQGGTATVNVESNIDWSLKISGETVAVTGITIDTFEWTSNFPSSAGTYLTKDYSTFNVTAHYNNGATRDVTNEAEITGQVILKENLTGKSRIVQAPINAKYGELTVSAIKKGFQSGASLPLEKPLTFNISSTGSINWVTTDSSSAKTIEYKINSGEWVSITSTAEGVAINVVAGDKIQFRGNNAAYSNGYSYINTFSASTAGFSVEGNIMSLINSTDFSTLTTLQSGHTFSYLFSNCTGLTSAKNLVLPATTLTYSCYSGMFYNCTSLTTAPALPATTLASWCYFSMFEGCTSLTTEPELPATTLSDNCYREMFMSCTSLTTAPALPATTLASWCYSGMFQDCTSLTTAPALPATTLADNCYSNMFYGCTKLNNIECLATDISASSCTNYWVSGVASTGAFIKNPNMNDWTRGVNGIPKGWSVLIPIVKN